jgi:hypothetical protein
MYVGLLLACVASGGLDILWGASFILIPLFPLLAVLAIVSAVFQFNLATLLVIPLMLAVFWFWLDEDHRLGSFFTIAVLTSLYPTVSGMWNPPAEGVVVLGVLPLLYLAIRFHPQILRLVATELAPEEEAEEEWEDEDGEEGEEIMRNPGPPHGRRVKRQE